MALGSAPSLIIGAGVGAAASVALTPAFEIPRQEAWSRNANRILDPGLMARLVAQGGVEIATAYDDAKRDGYAADKLDALVYLAQTTPAVSEALNLWRRGLLSDDLWTHVLVKAGLDARYFDPLGHLKTSEPTDPAVIATAIQRGIMHDPGFLPVGPPTVAGKVPAFPVSKLDTLDEAAQSGVNRERLFVQTALVGLPISLQQASSAYFRGIIERADFDRAVSEGNTRNEWGQAALDQARQILTAGEYAELELRGFLTTEERRAATGLHGMSTTDSDRLYDVLGRSIPVHQITTGFARGGEYDAPHDTIPKAYLSSLQRGNLRPEYYSLAYANRYSYPSAFVVRALLQDGALTEADGEQVFLNVGYPPDLAKKIAAHYSVATGAATDKHVAKAESQLWTTTHRSYIAQEAGDSEVTARLGALGIDPAAQDHIIALWRSERELVRKQLTPTQIRKAVSGKVTNPATGQPWSEAEARAALLDRGYSQADAQTFLAEG